MSENILIIEDDNDFAESLKIKIEETTPTAKVKIREFASALKELSDISPDVIILDVFKGEPQYEQREGLKVRDEIWRHSFVPLVFTSASRPDEVVKMAEKHPLVKFVFKEAGAIGKIANYIPRFAKYGIGIKEIRDTLSSHAEATTQKALTETVPHILHDATEPSKGLALVKSAAQRRLATLTRLKSEEDRTELFAWEQYLYPAPEVPYLLTGDILAQKGGDRNLPDAFRVVLSPSCDLAHPRTGSVLVGRCVPLDEFYKKNQLPELNNAENKKKAQNKLTSMLSQAQSNGYTVIPKYSDLIPPMAVSLRDLELLNVEGVKVTTTGGKEYERIVSLDSPFREQLAWAYLQIAGRPGLPDRDTEFWADEIISHLSKPEEKKR